MKLLVNLARCSSYGNVRMPRRVVDSWWDRGAVLCCTERGRISMDSAVVLYFQIKTPLQFVTLN